MAWCVVEDFLNAFLPMKRISFNIIIFLFAFAGPVQLHAQKAKAATVSSAGNKVLKIVSEHNGPVVAVNHPDILASVNRSGFETGQVLKVNNVYHMLLVNTLWHGNKQPYYHS